MILTEPDFWFFSPFFWAGRQHCSICLKNTSQKWTAFAFSSSYRHQTFTECVSSHYTHFDISTCQMLMQVIERPLILLCFWVFSYIFDDHSSLNCFISIKLSLNVCLINTNILICWHARCNHKLRKVLLFYWVLWKFQCLIHYSSSNFHKFCGMLMKII